MCYSKWIGTFLISLPIFTCIKIQWFTGRPSNRKQKNFCTTDMLVYSRVPNVIDCRKLKKKIGILERHNVCTKFRENRSICWKAERGIHMLAHTDMVILLAYLFFALKEGCIYQNLEPWNPCFLIENHKRRANINCDLYKIGPPHPLYNY